MITVEKLQQLNRDLANSAGSVIEDLRQAHKAIANLNATLRDFGKEKAQEVSFRFHAKAPVSCQDKAK